MSPAPRQPKGAPTPAADVVVPLRLTPLREGGHDELNIARLSLISAQSRVPADYTFWTRTYEAGERMVTVTCTALTGHVVPHGLDNDVMVAIINLYLEDGCPEDATVRVTLHRLLLAAGLSASAHYYREVRQCLRRLQSTSYQITQGWWSAGRRRHVDATFNHLWKVTASREGEDDVGSTLEIRLPDEIARSIREGYVKPLDLGVYRELSSPPVRAVYRVLDALRWDSGSAQDRVTVNLLEWGERLSIYSTEPDKIRRVLQPAHQELQGRGVLLAVEIQGRGRAQELTYVFAPLDRLPDPDLLRALIKRGMYPAVAGKYLTDHPDPEAVRLALRRFDAYPGRKQNAGALLRDMLVHPERYAEVLPLPQDVEARPARPAQVEVDDTGDRQLDEWRALSPERQWSRLEHLLTFSRLTPLLSPADREGLRSALLIGGPGAEAIVRLVTRGLTGDPAGKVAALRDLVAGNVRQVWGNGKG